MYRCADCGAVFDEPRRCYGEMLEHFGFPCREPDLKICPSCGGDSFEEVCQCSVCGAWLPEDEMEAWEDEANEDSGFLCEDCAGKLLRQFSNVVEAHFTPWERSYLAERLDLLKGA